MDAEVHEIIAVNVTRSWDTIEVQQGHPLTAAQMYDITRGRWRINEARLADIKYVCAAYKGIIKAVYHPLYWHDASQSQNATLGALLEKDQLRKEFVGELVEGEVAEQYVGKNVEEFLPSKLGRNPVRYLEKKEI